MVAILVLALLSGRTAAPSYVLAWALAIIVGLDPWAVATPGLWLSFGAVAVLVFASRRAGDMDPFAEIQVGRVARDDRAEAMETAHGDGASRAVGRSSRDSPPGRLARMGTALGKAARAQYAVTLGMIPLSLAWFGAVPVLGPLANAIAIPLMTMVVTPLALVSLILPMSLAGWALAMAHGVLVWLARWLASLSNLPWAVWQAATPSTWMLLLALVGVGLCLMPVKLPRASGVGRARSPSGQVGGVARSRWRRMTRMQWWFVFRLLGFGLMCPALAASADPPAAGEFRVTMLDIGQGNAVFVETARHTLLYDTGPPLGATDAGRRVIEPYLRAHGIAHLDRLVVSHAHDDHYGGARSVIWAFPDVPVVSSLPAGHYVRRSAASHRTCLVGQTWQWEGVDFRFLHPDAATLEDPGIGPNGRSCVLRIDNGRHVALLAGDAEAPQEALMLARDAGGVRADILLAPHHGSLTSSTRAFVAAVAPHYVVFQAGYRNRFAHPRPAVVARYRSAGAQTWTSADDGAVRFETGGDGIRAQAYRTVHRRYWHGA